MPRYGVDEYGRYEKVDGERCTVEHYPWPFRYPGLAVRCAWDVLMWHVGVIRQDGFREWRRLKAF